MGGKVAVIILENSKEIGKEKEEEKKEGSEFIYSMSEWGAFFSLMYKLHVTPPYSTIDRDDIETPFSRAYSLD